MSLLRRCVLLLTLLALPGLARAGSRGVILSAWDQVSAPGAGVTLSAKLERGGFGAAPSVLGRTPAALHESGARLEIWRRDLPDRTLEFRLQGELLGSAVTDSDGTARLDWTPPSPGEHRIEVSFAGDRKFAPGSDELLCAVRSPDRPTAILDIDHTLSHTSNWNVIRGRIDDPPLEHAVQVVPRIAAGHHVVYLTARPNKFLDVTKRWLAHHGFPRNPVYLLDIKDYPTYDEARYKTETLARIRAAFPDMPLGVGDKDSDAEAYRAHGLRALILGDTGDVAGAEPVEDWFRIEDLLFSARARRYRALLAGARLR